MMTENSHTDPVANTTKLAASKGKNWSDLKFPRGKRRSVFTGLDSEVSILEGEIQSLWKYKVRNVYEIGKRLIMLKERLKSDFKRTVEKNLPFSYSTAINYKNVAEAFDSSEDAALFDSRAMYALASSQYPADLREDIIARTKKGRPHTLQDIKNARAIVTQAKEDDQKTYDPEAEYKLPPVIIALFTFEEMLSELVAYVGTIPWPQTPTFQQKRSMERIWSDVSKLVFAFKPPLKKSNGWTSRH